MYQTLSFFLTHTLEYDLRCKQMKAKERKLWLIVLFNSRYESFCGFHSTFITEKNLTYRRRAELCRRRTDAMTGGAFGLIILLPFFIGAFPTERLMPTIPDFLWLLVLSSVSTLLLYLLQIQTLKVISAFTVNLTFNLEPIYSIIMAMLFFGEAQQLNVSFYAGLFMIFLSVALQTLVVARETKKAKKNNA